MKIPSLTLKDFLFGRRKNILFLIVTFLFLSPSVQASGFSLPAEFRIGLEAQYKSVASVSVGNADIYAGYGGESAVPFHSSSGFTVTPAKFYYAGTEQYFSTYETARSARDSYVSAGRAAVAVYQGGNIWSVYWGGYSSESEARNAGGTVAYPTRSVLLSWGGESVLFDKQNAFPQIADANGGVVYLGNRSYRGRIELFRYTNGNLQPVNLISVEQYLYSVVPSEMSSGWPEEALKAQAVASRSYSCTRMGIHEDQGYDLCDKSHCQNYSGAGNESASGTQAVQATAGLMVYYENEPINASYFSSSGGVTADSGDVWVNQVPYLVSVQEINEQEAKVWNRSFTLSEITGLLSANNTNIGQAVSVSIESKSAGRRVSRLIITGTNGSKTLEKEDIRHFFSPSSGGTLESRNFTIANGSSQTQNAGTQVVVSNGSGDFLSNVNGLTATSSGIQAVLEPGAVYAQGAGNLTRYDTASTTAVSSGNSVVFSGRGWGHGVGMSQFGAKGMAEAGYNFIQILEYYYTGTRVY